MVNDALIDSGPKLHKNAEWSGPLLLVLAAGFHLISRRSAKAGRPRVCTVDGFLCKFEDVPDATGCLHRLSFLT